MYFNHTPPILLSNSSKIPPSCTPPYIMSYSNFLKILEPTESTWYCPCVQGRGAIHFGMGNLAETHRYRKPALPLLAAINCQECLS